MVGRLARRTHRALTPTDAKRTGDPALRRGDRTLPTHTGRWRWLAAGLLGCCTLLSMAAAPARSEPAQAGAAGAAMTGQPGAPVLTERQGPPVLPEPPGAAASGATGQTTPTGPAEAHLLLPEGFRINGRTAKLVRAADENRWFLVFEELTRSLKESSPRPGGPGQAVQATVPVGRPAAAASAGAAGPPVNNVGGKTEPLAAPIEVLPCEKLADMTAVLGEQPDYSVDFRVWGEITVYQKRNYILPTFIAEVSLFGQDRAATAPKEKPKPASPLGNLLPSTQTSEPGNDQVTSAASQGQEVPDALRLLLQALPRTRPLATAPGQAPADPPAPAVPAAPGGAVPQNWREGNMVIDRVGRISYRSGAAEWLFVFETAAEGVAEPPVVLHPCRLLEAMEQVAGRSVGAVRFRVSGQITRHQGRSYLLLRKALVVYDLGNLLR